MQNGAEPPDRFVPEAVLPPGNSGDERRPRGTGTAEGVPRRSRRMHTGTLQPDSELLPVSDASAKIRADTY